MGPVAIDWQRFAGPREQVSIGLGGVLAGASGQLRTIARFSRPERGQELRALALTYGPFRLALAGGELIFHGRGPVAAGATERRMIFEWARVATIEAEVGRAGAAYGLVFSWHRGADSGGVCDGVAVYLTGEVRAGPCDASGEVRGRLDPARLARVYSWFDTLQAFQSDGRAGVRADTMFERLVFAGCGSRAATADDANGIGALAAALYRELIPAAPRPAEPREGTEP